MLTRKTPVWYFSQSGVAGVGVVGVLLPQEKKIVGTKISNTPPMNKLKISTLFIMVSLLFSIFIENSINNITLKMEESNLYIL